MRSFLMTSHLSLAHTRFAHLLTPILVRMQPCFAAQLAMHASTPLTNPCTPCPT